MFAAYISGIAATLTPCTMVLVPVFLYRFGIWGGGEKGRLYKDMLITFLGYVLGLLIVGLVVDSLTQSSFYNAVRIVLGVGFIIIGVLQIFGRFNVYLLQNISNSFVLGFVLPWALAVSPCVLPIFSSLLAAELGKGELYIKVIAFGGGLLSPALLVGMLGSKIFDILKKTSVLFSQIERLSGLILIGAGVYMNFQILEVRNLEVILSSLFLILTILLALYYIIRSEKSLSISRILMLLSVGVVWLIFTFSCYDKDSHLQGDASDIGSYQCTQEENCEKCNECATRFSAAAAIGGFGFVLAVAEEKHLIRLPRIKIKIS